MSKAKNEPNIVTLKIKYHTDKPEDTQLIREAMKQFTSVCHFTYNRNYDLYQTDKRTYSTKEMTALQKTMKNVDLLDSHFKNSAIYTMKHYSLERKTVFGGKFHMLQRSQGKLTNEEWKEFRLKHLCSVGEAPQKGNRKFKIIDTTLIELRLKKDIHINLNLCNLRKNQKKKLEALILLQNEKRIPITYDLDQEYVRLIFDLNEVVKIQNKPAIQGRVMSIDMNPNYIGYSVIDMNDDGTIKRYIDHGVICIKDINDKVNSLKGVPSNSPIRIYLNNKRRFEVLEISKALALLAKHYQCEIFALEDLCMKAGDKGLGRSFNRLVNNQWCRSAFTTNLIKRLKLFKIKISKVSPAYSSIQGNLVYKYTGLPDMVLASIVIARRAILFQRQYIDKTIPITPNIIFIDDEEVFNVALSSLEECGCEVASLKSWKDIGSLIKTRELRYRVPIEDATRHSEVFSMKSSYSNVNVIHYV